MPTLGEIIRDYRIPRQISQAEFGKAIGVDSQTVSNIETGRTKRLSGKAFRKAAEVMGLTPEELTEKVGMPPVANGRVADLLTGTIPPELFARVELVARARGRSWLEWLERVVANAEARIAAQQKPMGNPTYHKGDTTIELDPVPSQRRRRKADPTGGEHPPASAPTPRRGRKPS